VVGGGGGLVAIVNDRLGDPAFRQLVRDLHASGTPLVDMVDRLDLGDAFSAALRAVVASLPPAEVQAVRDATLEMLDRNEQQMPLDCTVTETEIDTGLAVDVTVVAEAGVNTIRVRPSTSTST